MHGHISISHPVGSKQTMELGRSSQNCSLPLTKPTTCVCPVAELTLRSLNFNSTLHSLDLWDISLGWNDSCLHCVTAEKSRLDYMVPHNLRWISFSHCREGKSCTTGFSQRTVRLSLARLAGRKSLVKPAAPFATHPTADEKQLLLTSALIGSLGPFRPGLKQR